MSEDEALARVRPLVLRIYRRGRQWWQAFLTVAAALAGEDQTN